MSSYDHEEQLQEQGVQNNEYDQNEYDQQQINQNHYKKRSQSNQDNNQDRNHRKQNKKTNKSRKITDSQHEDDDNDSQNHSQTSSKQSQEVQLTEQQKLQNQVLNIAIDMQSSTPYQDELTLELYQKLKDLTHMSKSKIGEDLITVRIQQLVINKVLVLTYNKNQFRLILSHYHLGQAYLQNQCIQQSIQHISIALHKIQKIFEAIPEARLIQTYMQNELAKSLIFKQNYEDAIQLLNASVNQENRLRQLKKLEKYQKQDKNTKALVLLSQCYSKIQNYDQSLLVIDEVIAITKKKKMAKQDYAFALVQKAKILALKKNISAAITFQQEAIDILMEENYSKPEEVAELYTVLSSYHQELNNVQNSLTCIQKVKTLYQQLYSSEDKRVIKARRKIATFLLKSQRFKQAVNELLQVVQLQQKVFGQNALQTARTLKLLGAVYISMEVADARAYLKRAMNIFQSHGNKKQVQQIREKLKMLYHDGENDSKDVRITGSQHEI